MRIPAAKRVDAQCLAAGSVLTDFSARATRDCLSAELAALGFTAQRSTLIMGGAGVIRNWICALPAVGLLVHDFNDTARIKIALFPARLKR